MRCSLCFLALAFAAGLSAQMKADTVYSRWGQPETIRYYSLIDADEMTQAERFQRGIKRGAQVEPIRQLDSILVLKGNVLFRGDEMHKLLGGSSRSAANRKVAKRKPGIPDAPGYIEGRAGMRVRRPVTHQVKGLNLEEIKRLDESPEIELIKNQEGETESLNAKIYIPAGATDRKLILDLGDGKKWEKLYTIRGYHLNETDFKRKDQLTEAQTWRAEGQDYLYLRLRSTEKLLYISQGETRYKPVPVGRQLDEVYLKSLATGKYLLEIIDLGTKEKRYHWLEV
jgi:hypothetical protein